MLREMKTSLLWKPSSWILLFRLRSIIKWCGVRRAKFPLWAEWFRERGLGSNWFLLASSILTLGEKPFWWYDMKSGVFCQGCVNLMVRVMVMMVRMVRMMVKTAMIMVRMVKTLVVKKEKGKEEKGEEQKSYPTSCCSSPLCCIYC